MSGRQGPKECNVEISYTATPEVTSNKEEMARRLAELTKAEPGPETAEEAAKLSVLYEEAAGFASYQAERAASRGDKAKALALSEEAIMAAINCKITSDIATHGANIAKEAKENENTPTTSIAYRASMKSATDAAVAAQIAAHYANNSKVAVRSIANLENVAEEATGSVSPDPAAKLEAGDEAAGPEEVAANLPSQSFEELAEQLEKAFLFHNE